MTPDALARYPADWMRATFGPAQADRIAALVTCYAELAAQRKPELIDANSFALGDIAPNTLDGGDFGARVAAWDALDEEMQVVKRAVPPEQRDAWFQLVDHPILALGNLYRLYYAVAWNRKLAAAGDARANVFADRAEAAFARDRTIAAAYHALGGGKWDGMMTQTHIGYTGWRSPSAIRCPALCGSVAKRLRSASP